MALLTLIYVLSGFWGEKESSSSEESHKRFRLYLSLSAVARIIARVGCVSASPEKVYRLPQQSPECPPSRPPPYNLCALPRRLQKDAYHPTVLPSAILDVLQAPVDDILMSMEVYPQELLTLVAWPEHNYPFYSSISVTYGPVGFCFLLLFL